MQIGFFSMKKDTAMESMLTQLFCWLAWKARQVSYATEKPSAMFFLLPSFFAAKSNLPAHSYTHALFTSLSLRDSDLAEIGVSLKDVNCESFCQAIHYIASFALGTQPTSIIYFLLIISWVFLGIIVLRRRMLCPILSRGVLR